MRPRSSSVAGLLAPGLSAVAVLVLVAGCGSVTARGAARPDVPTITTTPSASVSPSATPADKIQVVGLGDSVVSGEHCDCDDYVTGFGKLVTQRDGTKVSVTDDGVSGSTSSDLADDLQSDHDLRSDVEDADVVVVTTGANDLSPALQSFEDGSCSASCYDPQIETMGVDLGRALDEIDSLTDGHAQVLVTNYWNVFSDGAVAKAAEPSGYLAWSDAITRAANVAIADVAAAHSDQLVDLYAPFKGDGSEDPTDLLAADGDHPDDAGTAVISETVLAAYEKSR